jgi:glutamate racemase
MAIGVFDSGVGGLTIHRALVNQLPQADFLYLADQANAPYGGRGGEDIVDLTKQGCVHLFDKGANLVVLACNTASAIALRRLQQNWIQTARQHYQRPLNVLGIIVPTIEAATGMPWEHEAERRGEKAEKVDVLGVFSTPGTARSRVYEIEIDKRRQDVAVFSEPCPDLAARIESNCDHAALQDVINDHVAALQRKIGRMPDRAILGCTHYEIVADLFRSALPPGTPLIHQPEATAKALAAYVERHPEIDIGTASARHFYTTGTPGLQNGLVETFWGSPLTFESC